MSVNFVMRLFVPFICLLWATLNLSSVFLHEKYLFHYRNSCVFHSILCWEIIFFFDYHPNETKVFNRPSLWLFRLQRTQRSRKIRSIQFHSSFFRIIRSQIAGPHLQNNIALCAMNHLLISMTVLWLMNRTVRTKGPLWPPSQSTLFFSR